QLLPLSIRKKAKISDAFCQGQNQHGKKIRARYLLNPNTIKNPKFSKVNGAEFATVLKSRVNDYFKTNNLSKYGNKSMIWKSVFMLSLFCLPLVFVNIGIISSPLLLIAAYITSGLGMAGIGMSVMHD